MQFSIPIYQRKDGPTLHWVTLGLGEHTRHARGRNTMKIQQGLVRDLVKVIEGVKARELEQFELHRGLSLERVHMELSLKGGGRRRKIAGTFPLVLEPRWINGEERRFVVYHPHRQGSWFPLERREELSSQAATFFQRDWVELDDEEIAELKTEGRDRLRIIAFSARPASILDELPDRKQSVWDDLEVDLFSRKGKKKNKKRGYKVLPKIAVNLSPQAADGALSVGLAREPYRKQLQLLLGGGKLASTLVVGPPGVGKTTLLNRWLVDRLEADGYPAHRNLDRVHDVWSLSGRRLIAGMSYFGDWEERCIGILQDVMTRRCVLWVEDLVTWSRLGRTRDSDRCLADFFRGPLARGEVVMVGECTPEALQRLEDEAPGFAEQFTRLNVHETEPGETLSMMLHAGRELEQRYRVAFGPYAYRTVLELGGSLFPGQAFPGKALDLQRQIARDYGTRAEEEEEQRATIGAAEVVALLSKRTGLPSVLLEPSRSLQAEEVRETFERRVMGQGQAVEVAVELVTRIKAGLVDPGRPYGVYLFTGPTGTGKTELSRSIAAYLYGDPSRLLRFDMSEFSHAGAPGRLIGDRHHPEGLLTSQVAERPFCVVLLDEIEKAHPSVLNLLLQLFDEGRLTDASGRRADFTHAVVIMTSNLGARIQTPVGFGEVRVEEVMHDVAKAVQAFFPPELFNRMDRIVPFGPLTAKVAVRIVRKELSLLLARRGLTDRNITAYATESVIERLVAEAFDPRDGARSVKRYIEDHLGTLLTQHITSHRRAAMESLRLYVGGGEFQVHVDALKEVDPQVEALELESVMQLPTHDLEAMIPEALEQIEVLQGSAEVTQVSERLRHHLRQHNLGHDAHANPVWILDVMRQRLSAFAQRLKEAIEAREAEPGLLEELRLFAREPKLRGPGQRRRAVLDARLMRGGMERMVRPELLEILADVYFLKRALVKVHEEGQHEVFVELLRVGQARAGGVDWFGTPRRGLLEWLAEAYAERDGGLESLALSARYGEPPQGVHPSDLQEALSAPVHHLVMRKVGLCALERFRGEVGCHVRRAMSVRPELIRVRVWPAPPGVSPLDVIREHQEGVVAFQEALEARAPLPPNPERLLPLVRQVVWDPPADGGRATPVDLEDYALGYSETTQVSRLGDLLPTLWQLQMSAVGRSEEGAT
ncbi:MAG: hypothetical protein CMH57_01720 [Myxococcales bacterium]|nr:hypothetical protein [Myxococcales bacterium]